MTIEDVKLHLLQCYKPETPEDAEALSEILAVLNMRIEKRPALRSKESGKILRFLEVCPCCRSLLLPSKYCGECGQAIDWKEGVEP